MKARKKRRQSQPYRLFLIIPIAAAVLAVLFLTFRIVQESIRLDELEAEITEAQEENRILRETIDDAIEENSGHRTESTGN